MRGERDGTPNGAVQAAVGDRHSFAKTGVRCGIDRVLTDFADVCRLQTLWTLCYLERYSLSFVERAEAGSGDRRVVHEHILPLIRGDESVSLLTIEPLHLTLSHGLFLLNDCCCLRRGT